MKRKIKCIAIVALIAVIAVCYIKLFNGENQDVETSVEDKGSYSYYYIAPTTSEQENENNGINFYDK
ncbi:MAG: hypothetical protein PUA51_04460 [Oscillospiraceae bacterium]|nr:hypothetical protein [Oscillospiraceae bacterium]